MRVSLVEQKPARMSPAHTTPLLAELVCSNSLRSDDAETPAGLLKEELRRGGLAHHRVRRRDAGAGGRGAGRRSARASRGW